MLPPTQPTPPTNPPPLAPPSPPQPPSPPPLEFKLSKEGVVLEIGGSNRFVRKHEMPLINGHRPPLQPPSCPPLPPSLYSPLLLPPPASPPPLPRFEEKNEGTYSEYQQSLEMVTAPLNEVTEKVKEEELYQTFQRITEDSNGTWSKHQDPLLGDIMVPQEKGNVALSTGLHGWVLTLTDFAKTYNSKFGIYKSKKNIRQDYQRGSILTKLGDDLKSDEKTLQKKALIIHGLRVDEYSSTEGAPVDPSVRNLDALDLAEDLNNIEKGMQEAYTELVENHDMSKRHYQDDVEQYMWNSQVGGSYTNTHGMDETRGRNTKSTLFLKGYQLEYLEKHSFEELIKKRSDFMSYTIFIWVEKMIKGEISNKEDKMVHYFLHVVSLLFSSFELDTKSVVDIRTRVLEEKIVATQACGLFVLITKSIYVLHLEESRGYLIWSTGYFHEDTLRVADTAVKMSVWAAKQRDVWVNEHGGTKNMMKRTEDGLKLKETDDEQQQQEKFEGFVVSFLGLLWVYLSYLPLHVIEMPRVTHSFLHLEDKVKVWAAGIVKPN
ncbi:unnamed protein product [Lactuca virosa]|uniref:Uncharacterized protein n=1 Tax=Lactuca virosa TaxID=75947 RepID=A0AAU9LNP6_9ASTR|nr:unnamed protein product [Lactuca virosa]